MEVGNANGYDKVTSTRADARGLPTSDPVPLHDVAVAGLHRRCMPAPIRSGNRGPTIARMTSSICNCLRH